jgi:hypothetical protein
MPLSSAQSAVIAREVQSMLADSPALASLAPRERAQIVASTTAVATQLVDRELAAPLGRPRAHRDPYALGLADEPLPFPLPGAPAATPPAAAGPDPSQPTAPWRPDERFAAEGVSQAVTQTGRMVNEVNFPAFVSSLVKGTFNAVVDASIQQMKAYGDLVNSVAMSINDFAEQKVELGEGRRHLAQKYPNVFDLVGDQLKVKDDFDDSEMPSFGQDLGTAPVEDLDEETVDRLVVAARTEIARGRQQLLATTILMGINRIIVTDGRINAKIVFDVKAHDKLDRQGQRDEYDTSQKKVRDFEFGMADQYVKGHFETPVPIQVSTTTAQSTAEIDAKAKLTGEVSLNFKSETFPLEKMMTSEQLLHLNTAQSGARATPPAAAAPTPAAPPAPPPAAPAPAAPPMR